MDICNKNFIIGWTQNYFIYIKEVFIIVTMIVFG